jgi:hypothetical protein
MLNRLRAGHYCLKSFLRRINIVPDATCDCGEATETPNHILWQCKRFEVPREAMLRDLIKCNEYPPYKMDSRIIKSITRYLTRIDINI